jgi:hypothetical protein
VLKPNGLNGKLGLGGLALVTVVPDMTWLTCWGTAIWFICLPAGSHHQAEANAHTPQTFFNLTTNLNDPQLFKLDREWLTRN